MFPQTTRYGVPPGVRAAGEIRSPCREVEESKLGV